MICKKTDINTINRVKSDTGGESDIFRQQARADGQTYRYALPKIPSTCNVLDKDAERKYIGGTQIVIFWLKSRDQELSNSI